MSNLDPNVMMQPFSQKLLNLVAISDDLVTLTSGTIDLYDKIVTSAEKE